jgi:hypothetical protein
LVRAKKPAEPFFKARQEPTLARRKKKRTYYDFVLPKTEANDNA